jgi:DUF971 family protein/molybdopterin converting factor small subunit
MSNQASKHLPTEIKLHQKSRILSIGFNDGKSFELPCEYLRVFSKAAEVRTMDRPVVGKESVNIESIEAQGQYAVRLLFDDGHDTGIYSWDTLYSLGEKQQENWRDYLKRLDEMGYQRDAAAQQRKVKLLYFGHLVKKLRKEAEDLELPANVESAADLLAFLRRRKPQAAPLFADQQVRITVNRQFAESFTKLEDGDEIALVPTSPFAPATPDLI